MKIYNTIATGWQQIITYVTTVSFVWLLATYTFLYDWKASEANRSYNCC